MNNIKLEYNPDSEGVSIKEALAKALKQARKERNLTQRELAEKIGKSESLIRKYEKGLVFPNYDTLLALASALDIDPLLLLTGLDYRMYESVLYNLGEIAINNKSTENNYDRYSLEQKLGEIDYYINGIDSEGYMWIEYPDGTLEVNIQQLKALNDATKEYLKLRLDELKKNNLKDFKPKKQGD